MHPITKDRIETNKYKNIKDITDYKFDVQELLKYTNYLIVDYSSISIDFYLTDRPVIYYPYDEKQYYLKDRDMYFKYKDISIKETTTNNEFQLLKIIENIEIISKNENYIKKYNEFKNFWHFYKD
jgi:CDP-glycerol glycerophosphotransferase (TagB/SpsB family)